MANRIVINGVEINGDFAGRNIFVKNGKFKVDGQYIDLPDVKVIQIAILGDVGSITCESGDVGVKGSVGQIKTQSGDVRIVGNVTGDVKTMSGDVHCGAVGGNCKTMSGDINRR